MSLQAVLRTSTPPRAAAPASFDALYDAHADGVWRMLLRLGVQPMHVEDAAQEVFVTAWKRLKDFEGRSTMKTWLTGIALRVAAHHRRSWDRRGKSEPLDESMPSPSPLPDDRAQQRQDLELLQRVLANLPDEQREAFVMLEMEGFSAPEASEVLGAPINTLYSRLRLARAAFNAAVARLKELEP